MERRNRRLLILVVLFLMVIELPAQDRYMVFFKDKQNSSYSVDNPTAFLSQRAIERRTKNGFLVSETDLPVNETYVDGVEAEGADVFFTTRWMNGALVQMDSSQAEIVEGLEFVSSIEFIAPGVKLSNVTIPYEIPDQFLEPTSVADDTEVQLAMIGVDEMHADGYTGEGIRLAVLDDGFSGINTYKPFEHIFDEGRFLMGRDFVKNSGNPFQYDDHGSAAFSTISAKYGEDISGTAPDAEFLLFVTEDYFSEYRVEEYNWLIAVEVADSAGVDIISSSLGYSTFSSGYGFMDYDYEDMDGETTVISKAAQMAADRGMLVIVSAGNEGSEGNSWKYITSPADGQDVMAVGSVTITGDRSSFSSFGPTSDGRTKPDIMALGSSATVFTYSNSTSIGKISRGSGTSFAAPQIAGLAAGLLQAHPEWTREDLLNAIKYTGTNALNPDNEFGYGIANYAAAVQGVVLSANDILEDRLTVFPNPFSDNRVYIDFGEAELKHDVEVMLIDNMGRQVFEQQYESKSIPTELEINFHSTEKGIYYLIVRSRRFEKKVKLIKF